MVQCSIDDKSVKFSRFTHAVLIVVAYLIQSKWLVLLVSALMILGSFSLSLNIFYQIHRYFLKRKNGVAPKKDFGELSFTCVMTGIMVLFGFILLQFTPYTALAWTYTLIIAGMIFIACFVGFCPATLLYILIKSRFTPKKNG